MRAFLRVAAAAAVVVATFTAFTAPAGAHERRMVGPYQFVVGWLNEPAYVGSMNSLDLRVTDTRATPAKAIEGLEKTLTVDVQSGGLAPYKLTVTARFNTPGAYNGYVLPTATGTYIFNIKGKVESLDVNERFESGPGRFGDIESITDLQYPSKVPGGTEVSDRLGAIQSDLTQLRLLAAAAIALGLIAIGAPFLMRRRA